MKTHLLLTLILLTPCHAGVASVASGQSGQLANVHPATTVARQTGRQLTRVGPSLAPLKLDELKKKIDLANGSSATGSIEAIVKMIEGGVEPAVVLAYVENSPIAYNLNAEEILHLHNRGVSSEIIAAMIRRGGELRARQAEVAREAQNRIAQQPQTPPTPPYTQTPVPAPTVPPVTQNYYVAASPQTYPVYSYAYAYSYPVYRFSYAAPFYPTYSYRYSRPFYRHPVRYYGHNYPRFPRIGVVSGRPASLHCRRRRLKSGCHNLVS